MADIVVTLPKHTDWVQYLKEVEQATSRGEALNFKVAFFPKEFQAGVSRCYLVHQGRVKGYHTICALETKRFKCTTSGRVWDGKFIVRDGPFVPCAVELPMKGFQGWRYFSEKDFS